MFIVLMRRTFPGLQESNFSSYKALSSMNKQTLFFTGDLVIFSHFKVGSDLALERAVILKNLASELYTR